jgi:uncharacterized membrane protein YgaE (UPF0421/DUF939 family)
MDLIDIGTASKDLPREMLVFVVAICGVLIALLLGAVVFFIKREFKKSEEKFRDHGRWIMKNKDKTDEEIKENKDRQEKINEQHNQLQNKSNMILNELNINLTALRATVKMINDGVERNEAELKKQESEIKEVKKDLKEHVQNQKIHILEK